MNQGNNVRPKVYENMQILILKGCMVKLAPEPVFKPKYTQDTGFLIVLYFVFIGVTPIIDSLLLPVFFTLLRGNIHSQT